MAGLLEESNNLLSEAATHPEALSTTRFWHKRLTLTGHAKPRTPVPWMILYMIIDVGTYMLTIVSFYYLLTRYLILPVERGFYCNDPEIRRPFHENTISTTLLLIITLFFPYIIIFGDFWIRKDLFSNGRTLFQSIFNPSFQTCRSTCYVYLDYVLSFGILTYLLEIVKCYTGRLRPNFIQLCKPSTLFECEENPLGYITSFICQTSFKHSRNSRLSFPSGHAAASIFSLLFLAYFLQRTERKLLAQFHDAKKQQQQQRSSKTTDFKLRLKTKLSMLYTKGMIAMYGGFCVICCASRVLDNWHFMSDVIGGILFALLSFFILLKSYTKIGKPINQKID
uniref:Phosphatidic acid phosphatase type 2/haloperoxidase domain-containing protein n=1 Tax=Panagrolaimus superbus TaxID=310955 RepID=A0A914XVS3_9BILA